MDLNNTWASEDGNRWSPVFDAILPSISSHEQSPLVSDAFNTPCDVSTSVLGHGITHSPT